MRLAIEQARMAGEDVPVGAVIVSGQAVVAAAFNQRERLTDPAGHAEIVALREAAQRTGDWRLSDTTIYVTLEPCPMCAEAIIQARVQRLVFGAYDAIAGACGSAFNLFVTGRPTPLPEVIGGINEDDCQAILREFFRAKRSGDPR